MNQKMYQTGMTSLSSTNDPYKKWIRNPDGTWINQATLSIMRPSSFIDDSNLIGHFGSPVDLQVEKVIQEKDMLESKYAISQ